MRKLLFVLALSILPLAAVSCRPELRIRLTTQIFHDGSLERRLEVRGWEPGGEIPTEEDWLASDVGLRLAEPGAWGRVDCGLDRLEAEGFFPSAADLPPLLTYSTDEGLRENRVRTQLEIDEKVVVTRWSLREFHGDPFGREATESALDGIVELLADALESELRRQFGEQLETAPARELLRTEGHSLALAMISVGRSVSPLDGAARRAELWAKILTQHGLPTASFEQPEEFWDAHLPLLVDWARTRVADAVSTPRESVSPDDLLPFWPDRDSPYDRLEEWVANTWDDPEAIEREIESHANTVAGYYGRDSAPRFRFEIRVSMPGTLLSTNGTPEDAGARWLFRNDDMAYSDFVLRVESVEPIDETLIALGARRPLSAAQLVHLADILWKRDTQGVLADLLDQAVQRERLEVLREGAPEGFEELAFELANLLDPYFEP